MKNSFLMPAVAGLLCSIVLFGCGSTDSAGGSTKESTIYNKYCDCDNGTVWYVSGFHSDLTAPVVSFQTAPFLLYAFLRFYAILFPILRQM